MKFSDMYPKDRFYAAEFKGKPVTLTFRKTDPPTDPVTHELLGKGGPSEKEMPIWHFNETPKKLPAIITNGVCARAMFGDESNDWAGHKITLYPAQDTSGQADDGLCIRVKGSPELERKLVFKAQIGRSKQTFTLVPTGTAKPPASVDPVTGEVGDDIGFDGPEASQEPQDGASTHSEGDDGLVPGRGPKSAQGELS